LWRGANAPPNSRGRLFSTCGAEGYRARAGEPACATMNLENWRKDGRQDMQELRERLIGLKERIAHVLTRL